MPNVEHFGIVATATQEETEIRTTPRLDALTGRMSHDSGTLSDRRCCSASITERQRNGFGCGCGCAAQHRCCATCVATEANSTRNRPSSVAAWQREDGSTAVGTLNTTAGDQEPAFAVRALRDDSPSSGLCWWPGHFISAEIEVDAARVRCEATAYAF